MIKKTGQHFLIDECVAEREVDYAGICKDDVVLEIGPGTGIITRFLAAKAQRVLAVEIDKYLVQQLQNNMSKNVILMHGDALKVDYKQLPKFNKIVSNLPFQISSPITFKLLEHDFSLAVLMYQKEFAERMVAEPHSKQYSRLTVHLYYKAICEILETVPKTCFNPQPKVDSCIVRLKPRKTPPFNVEDEQFFLSLTKKLFNHRRKKIKNILSETQRNSLGSTPYLNQRVEELFPEEIGKLSNLLISAE